MMQPNSTLSFQKILTLICILAMLCPSPGSVSADEGIPQYALPEQALRIDVSAGWIGPLAFSPDNRYLAVGMDAGVKIFDLKDLSLRKWIQLAYQVDDLAFSPDGKLLAAISHYNGPYKNTPNLAHIWKTANWSLVNTVEDGKGAMTGLVWDPSGRSFFTSRAEIDKNNVAVYQWYASGAAASALTTPPVLGLVADDRGRWLFAAADNGYILRYRLSDNQLLDRFHLDGSGLTSLSLLPEGAALLAADSFGRVVFWDLSHYPPVSTVIRPNDAGSGLSLAADGSLFAVCLSDGRVALQEPVADTAPQEFALDTACVRTRFSPDARWLAVSGVDGAVRLIPMDPAVKPEIFLHPAAAEIFPSVEYNPQIVSLDLPVLSENALRTTTVDRLSVVRSGLDTNGIVKLFRSQLPPNFSVHARNGRLLLATHLPTGGQAIIEGDDVSITFSNADQPVSLPGDGARIHTAVFNPEGAVLAAGAVDGGVSLWKMPEGKKFCDIFQHPVQVKALQFNKQGDLLAVGYDDLTIEVYSLVHCARGIIRLPATTRHVNDLEFSPDDTLLISAAADTSAQVFEVNTGRLLDRFEPDHAKKGLHAVAIHPGQVILAVGSYEGVLTLFNLRTGQFIARYRPGTTDNPITDLVFTTGGEQLLVFLADETWVVYGAPQ